jgi:hypothetical protein
MAPGQLCQHCHPYKLCCGTCKHQSYAAIVGGHTPGAVMASSRAQRVGSSMKLLQHKGKHRMLQEGF